MNSYIDIFFNGIPVDGHILSIQDSYTPSLGIDLLYGETIPLKTDISDVVFTTYNFLNNNYNSSNRYVITPDYTPGDEKIRVYDNIGSSQFSILINNTSSLITTTILNESVTVPLSISGVTISENATDACSLVDIEITTNFQADFITSPVSQAVTSNPFTVVGVNRDSINDINITLEATGINNVTRLIYVPILNTSIFEIETVSIPSGSTVNVKWLGNKQSYFTILYSIDNINFSQSTSFSNLQVGNYTMYVKDDIGCNISIPFEITAFEPNAYTRLPFFNVSKQNSLICVKREEIDDINYFWNITNTLSYEEQTLINRQDFVQKWKKTDGIIQQQFNSNFENVSVTLVDCNGTESVIIPEQKTQNLNVTDLRDVTVKRIDYLNAEFVGAQYVQGNTYNPITLAVTGEYYLANSVPSFMNVEDYLGFGSSWFKVRDIVFINDIQTLVLDVLADNFILDIIGEHVLKGESVYNVQPYETFNYNLDLTGLDGFYYMKYEATDSEFETLKEQTEWFEIAEEQKHTYLLQYYNSVNNETNYATGITNKIRIPYDVTVDNGMITSQDKYITDTNVVQIDSDFRSTQVLITDGVPTGFMEKLGLITSNDRLFLNGLSLLREEIENERIGVTNEYRVTITFDRSDYVFSSIDEDGSVVLPSGQPLATDDDGNGLIFYKD